MAETLITGGTGFLGSALARALVERGRTVRVLARPTSDTWRLRGLNVEVVRGDVLQPETLSPALEGVDAVYHAAGMLGGMPVSDAAYHELHVDGTRNVLLAAREHGVRRVVHVSSPGVLGPIDGLPADETAPYAPTNIYEVTKAEGEELALSLAAESELSLVVARPEFVYGPGDRHVLGLFRMVQRGLFFYIGSGESLVHPTYVDDAVQGMLLCGERGRDGRVYHIAGPEPVTIRQLATTIAAAMGREPPRLHVPRPLATVAAVGLEAAAAIIPFRPPLSRGAIGFFTETRAFSTARAQQELGYRAHVGLPEGVRHTVAWYRDQSLL